jgi:hypothetical protein
VDGRGRDLDHRARHDRRDGRHVGGMVVSMYLPMFKLISVVAGGH